MIIANPIYDVVFKRLMENEKVAKFFIGTLLNEKVESLQLQPQEFTYSDELVGIAVFRLDFIAIIETEDGKAKKVLIEIQKAKNETDLMRFRNYLAEQYKKQETIAGKKQTLPLTTIYVLGFKLRSIDTACLHVERQYTDMINEAVLTQRNDFIERLTHDSYVVQLQRITQRYQSRLDKLLSIFEQAHFVDDNEIVKEYPYEVDDEDVKEMATILHHSGTDPKARKEIEVEQEAWRSINALFATKERSFQKQLEQKNREIEDKERELERQQQRIAELEKKLKGKP